MEMDAETKALARDLLIAEMKKTLKAHPDAELVGSTRPISVKEIAEKIFSAPGSEYETLYLNSIMLIAQYHEKTPRQVVEEGFQRLTKSEPNPTGPQPA